MKTLGMRVVVAMCGATLLGGLTCASPRAASHSKQAAASAATETRPEANPKDVESVDAIIAAIYNVISGPAGERDWNRFRSLFIPEGRLTAVRVGKDGKISYVMMSVEDYINRAGAHFKEQGFFESEASRKTETFGQMAHVYTTYESRNAKDAAPFARGINSIELFNDGKRWWCVSIYWDSERPGNPIPEKYLSH
jgi:hypothetical protein